MLTQEQYTKSPWAVPGRHFDKIREAKAKEVFHQYQLEAGRQETLATHSHPLISAVGDIAGSILDPTFFVGASAASIPFQNLGGFRIWQVPAGGKFPEDVADLVGRCGLQ